MFGVIGIHSTRWWLSRRHRSRGQSGAPDVDLRPMSKAGHGRTNSSSFDVMPPGGVSNGHPGRTRSGAFNVKLCSSPRTNQAGTHLLVIDASTVRLSRRNIPVRVTWCWVSAPTESRLWGHPFVNARSGSGHVNLMYRRWPIFSSDTTPKTKSSDRA